MAARAKDVTSGRKGIAAESPNVSKSVAQVKSNPKTSHSLVGGTTEKGATPSGKPLPHSLKASVISSSDLSKTSRKDDASEAQGQAKTTRRSPSLKSASSAPSTLQSSLPKRSHSSSTSPTSRFGTASSPATAPTELGRSSSSKILRPHVTHPTNTSNNHNKLVSANKTKSVPSSNRGRQMNKAGRDSVLIGSQEDQIEEKAMIVQECQDISKYPAGTTISDDDTDLDKAKISEDQQEDYETFSLEKSSPKATAFEAETKESDGNGKNKDAGYVKVNIGGAYAATDAQDADAVKQEEKAEEVDGTSHDEASDSFHGEPEDTGHNDEEHKQEENNDNDELKVEKPRIQGEDLPRVKGAEGPEDTPRKLNFRKGTILSPKVEDDMNQPRRLSFKNKQVQNEGGGDDTKTEDENVGSKQQAVQQKKENAVVFNQVIEDTASKLVGARKSKVLALAGAFETVISIHETSARSSQSYVNVQSPPPLAAAPALVSNSESAPEGIVDPAPTSPPLTPAPASIDEEVRDDSNNIGDNDANVSSNHES